MYLKKRMWSFYGPHSTTVCVSRATECKMHFVRSKHKVKSVVLFFYLTECQICKILARVDVRRFQFLVMLQLVGVTFQGYSQCSPGTSVRHSCLPRNFSSTAGPMCRKRQHELHLLVHCRRNSSGCWGASTSWTWPQRAYNAFCSMQKTLFGPFPYLAYHSWSDILSKPQWHFPNSFNTV